MTRESLADFLKTRRARLSPTDVGLPNGSRRRTPGLRREEVAILAHVGISWYTALEQGRDIRPSEAILHSLADVLRLTMDERQHLFWLAGQHLAVNPQYGDEEKMCPTLPPILPALDPNPAYILGQRWNYRAWNQAANFVFSITRAEPPYAHNLLWQLFMNPEKRHFFVHWEAVAQNVVAEFRAEVEKYASDAWTAQLIADLRTNCPEFELLWQQHNVQSSVIRQKALCHPQAGRLLFDHTPLQLMGHPTLKLIVYTPDAESAHRLKPFLPV